MTYREFVRIVKEQNFTPAELRCDVPPSESIMELIGQAGARYEAFVAKYLTIDGETDSTKRIG